MKKHSTIALVAFTILYTLLFWKEQFGLNLLLYSLGILTYLFTQFKNSFKETTVKITLVGTLVTGLMVIIINSTISKFAFLSSLWILVGFIHHPSLQSIQHIIQYIILHYLKTPVTLIKELSKKERSNVFNVSIFYYLKIIAIPLMVLAIFYLLFFYANPKFAELSNQLWEKVFQCFEQLLSYVSFPLLFFSITGIFITAGLVYTSSPTQLKHWLTSHKNNLVRQRKIRRGRVFDPMNALRNEYRAALVLIGLVNLLLLIVNTIDISWIWINFTIPKGMVLKHFVHEGTYLLIASIILSIAIILYYFRNNLNFYPNNTSLKTLAYVWMVQNVILSISVCLRNYHYINMHGLAYKRLGVIIFLALTVIGLITMMIKIHQIKTAFYIVKSNLWACYLMMVLMSMVNWDLFIAKFNLAHWNKQGIDVAFYLTISPKTIPYLLQNLPTVEEQLNACNRHGSNYTEFHSYQDFYRALCNKKLAYLNQQKEYSIFSWNLADAQTINALK